MALMPTKELKMNIEQLVKDALIRQGTKQERLAAHTKRSIEFNRKAQEDFESQRVTPELLNKRCTL